MTLSSTSQQPPKEGQLQAPDNDHLVSCINTYLGFMTRHAISPWPATVQGMFLGQDCRYAHCIIVPLYDPREPYETHINDVITFYWFPPYQGTLPLMYDIIPPEKAAETDCQYRAYVYPQASEYLTGRHDLNRFWHRYTGGLLKLLGPMLVVKYSPSNMRPQPLDKVEGEKLLKRLYLTPCRLFFEGEVCESYSCGVADC
ncbi:hypothetical protein VNI00_019312 [Paramarasmius palmivorus]|uniref:Uncharacterized protein n=1 Tax=Paramarasmius palmivorus TaxID=297713 RepID=A0AAW0ANE4_9AGAR